MYRFIYRLKLFLGLILYPMLTTGQIENVSSNLEVYSLEFDERQLIYAEDNHFEAPNWSRDGQFFIINQAGLLYRISLDGKVKSPILTGDLASCNNDHGLTVDGKLLAISNNDLLEKNEYGTSRIYVMEMPEGNPELITSSWPSYWHGWSPDGKTIVYTAYRQGDFDVYKMNIDDKKEIRLTDAEGLDDGPEYSADGRYIYYNSMGSGSMEIWRMDRDGSNKVQITDDNYSNWFPHPSPDNRNLIFLSYLKDQGDRHPPMKEVALRLLDMKESTIRTLCTFTGGQGSINVPSWSPDGSKVAFVSYSFKNKSDE